MVIMMEIKNAPALHMQEREFVVCRNYRAKRMAYREVFAAARDSGCCRSRPVEGTVKVRTLKNVKVDEY